jgi:mono/diheme cytochrome c family protein
MQIREGDGRMPAFDESRLSAAQLEELVAYLTTIGTVTGELPAGGGAEPLPSGDDVAPDDTTTDDTM